VSAGIHVRPVGPKEEGGDVAPQRGGQCLGSGGEGVERALWASIGFVQMLIAEFLPME